MKETLIVMLVAASVGGVYGILRARGDIDTMLAWADRLLAKLK